MQIESKNIKSLITESYLPYKSVIKLLVLLALGLQLIVLSQMYFFGNGSFNDPQAALFRLFRGTLLSFIAGAILIYPGMSLIAYLNLTLPWKRKSTIRFIVQFLYSIIAGLIVTPAILLLAQILFSLKLDVQLIINNSYYIVVLSLFLTTILEALKYFEESDKEKRRAAALEKELLRVKFDVLKSQINPHFLFNSLNVLSGLISIDTQKAQLFIDEFSSIYRYVLETIELPVTELRRELEFAKTYLYLNQIRLGDSLTYSLRVEAYSLNYLLPPLSLQIVLENAIKHNVINEESPLHIEIIQEKDTLTVKNKVNLKKQINSHGTGLVNLEKRYGLISEKVPSFFMLNDEYQAILPLINQEIYESINN